MLIEQLPSVFGKQGFCRRQVGTFLVQNVPYKMVTFGVNSGYIVNVLTEFTQVTFFGQILNVIYMFR